MTSQPADTLRSRYVAQAAADLEENRRVQQQLADRLSVLKQEEALLADILSLAERYEGLADASRRPEQPQDGPVAAKAKRASSGATARSAGGTGRAAKAHAKETPPQPLLGDLLAELLGQHKEPRPAKELRDELLATHPDRSPTPQVVRNTLESLVAKGRIRRHKQQRSVMYTLVEQGDSD
ncbi:hypothetical protein ABZT06_01075 [Streptomyces sp. NPDC005483]|uniref:hypothetical protein n=1 Tax=Streptomyces sp. NPDC005483 TaxID=3154882 RepID=UPI0033BD1643